MKGVKYISTHDRSGYGTAARRVIRGLQRAGVPVTWAPMVGGSAWGLWYQPYAGRSIGDPEFDDICNLPIEYDTVIVHVVPEYFTRWRTIEGDRRMIGHTVWETDSIPHHWPLHLEQMDHVMVPCTWNKAVFDRRGLTVPVSVLPHIMREDSLPEGNPPLDVPPDHFVFYCIEVWSARKALWNVVRSYLDAFTEDDPVTLVLKTSPRDSTRQNVFRQYPDIRRVLRDLSAPYPNPARICLVTEILSDDDLLRLHRRGDCYISLSHGEGWNLGAFDAATYGKPSVITGFGGQLDFLPRDLAYLVDYRLAPVDDSFGRPSFLPDQNWAEPSTEHASALMREVFEHRDEARRRGAALQALVRERFSEKPVMAELLKVLST